MSANDNPESAAEEADRRVERAKASLLARVDALKHKVNEAKDQLDFKVQIARHPLPAIGIAFAVGALAALSGRAPAPRAEGERSLSGAALGALAAFGLKLARELAIGQLGHVAKQWWSEQSGQVATPLGRSHADELEPFLEH